MGYLGSMLLMSPIIMVYKREINVDSNSGSVAKAIFISLLGLMTKELDEINTSQGVCSFQPCVLYYISQTFSKF